MIERCTGWARAILLMVAFVCGPAIASSAAPAYTGLVVFGDSLSDSGNVARYSDGPVWVEVVARSLGGELKPSRLGGTNYAASGARTHGGSTDIRSQADSYLTVQHRSLDPSILYVIYGGANDLLAGGCTPGRDEAARNAAAALRATVDELAAAGAKDILVPNLPDIGYAPIVRAQGSACVKEARRLTQVFNTALERSLQEIERKRGIRILRLDVFALGEAIMADPARSGFRNIDTPCAAANCDGALFYDSLHPSSFAHAKLAAAALHAIGFKHE